VVAPARGPLTEQRISSAEDRRVSKGEDVKKTGKRKLTLSKETIVNLEAGKLAGAAGATHQLPAFSDLWEKTTCV